MQKPEDITIPSDYIILNSPELGRGSIGQVYKVQVGDQFVAIKYMFNKKGFDAELCKVSDNLSHPNLIQYLNWSEERGIIAMEYAPLGNLRKFISEQSQDVSLKQKLTIASQIIEGLHYLHAHGFMHRNLKPENILLSGSEQNPMVQLSDRATTSTTGPKVSLAYMAPELFDDVDYTEKVDIYSFGMVLYTLLMGNNPFEKLTNLSIMNELSRRFRPELPGGDECPASLKMIIINCWAQNPNDLPSAMDILNWISLIRSDLDHRGKLLISTK